MFTFRNSSGLEVFVAKRIAVFTVTLMLCASFLENSEMLQLGLLAGGLAGIIRFLSYAYIFGLLGENAKQKKDGIFTYIFKSRAFVYFINQVLLLVVLFVSYFVDIQLFAGIAAGILTLPAVVITNAVTESLGITKNNFYM